MNILVVTGRIRVIQGGREEVRLENGRRINLRGSRVLSFRDTVPYFLGVPHVRVFRERIYPERIPLSAHLPHRRERIRALAESESFLLSSCRDLLRRNSVRDMDLLLEWFGFSELLFRTLAGLLLLYSSDMFRFSRCIFEKAPLEGLSYWEALILTPLSYAVLVENERMLKGGLSRIEDPVTCANTALGYLMGDRRFFSLFTASLRNMIRFGFAEAHRTEPHGGFSTHAGELRKLREGVEPPENRGVFLAHEENRSAGVAGDLSEV